MTAALLPRIVLSVTSLYGGVGAYVADWNETHIHNPAWPPHARFHNAQTMSLGAALTVLTLVVLWGGGKHPTRQRLGLATALGSTYCATQLSALLYPGTALVDPPAKRGPQGFIAAGVIVVDLVTFLLAARGRRA